MKFITTNDTRTGEEIRLSYCDYGKGRPVVLIHGWPSSKEMWEYQVAPIVNAGFRCIKYDRRGFGKSSKPWDYYDYDALADDLKAILDQLDLQDVVLVGFSMGGGEVARYFSRHGGARVTKAVLVSTVLPFLQKTDNNPDGVDAGVFETMMQQMKEDRVAFLESFGKQFFGVSMINHPVSAAYLGYFCRLAEVASPRAMQQCAQSFAQTDFRKDVPSINVPTLIIHGDDDKIVPIASSSNLTAQMVKDSRFIVYEDAPHGLFVTDRERLNNDLLTFAQH
jgi:pimeloyl-ACP methyl ester carboxylesterase